MINHGQFQRGVRGIVPSTTAEGRPRQKFKTNSPVGEQDHKFIGKNEISISPRNSVFFAMEKITKLEQLSKTRIYLVAVAITEPNRRLNLAVAYC